MVTTLPGGPSSPILAEILVAVLFLAGTWWVSRQSMDAAVTYVIALVLTVAVAHLTARRARAHAR